MRPRLLLADDHRLVLEGLSSLLSADYDLVGLVEDGEALVASARALQPDAVLLDMTMPKVNGLEAARQLLTERPELPVVFVTMRAEADYVREAFRAGARGYVLKNSAASELATAVREVLRGRYFVAPIAARELPGAVPGASDAPPPLLRGDLTVRQREVLRHVAEGQSAKEIAHRLRISTKTVEFHKAGIMQQLGLRTTAELTRYAIKHGLVGE